MIVGYAEVCLYRELWKKRLHQQLISLSKICLYADVIENDFLPLFEEVDVMTCTEEKRGEI